jgi:aminomethyltransferase
MGYVEAALASAGTALHASVRGQPVPVAVAGIPFVPTRYKRR